MTFLTLAKMTALAYGEPTDGRTELLVELRSPWQYPFEPTDAPRFEIRGVADRRQSESRNYQTCFRCDAGADLGLLRLATAAAEHLEHRLQLMQATFGAPGSFASYVQRVLLAADIREVTVAMRPCGRPRNPGQCTVEKVPDVGSRLEALDRLEWIALGTFGRKSGVVA